MKYLVVEEKSSGLLQIPDKVSSSQQAIFADFIEAHEYAKTFSRAHVFPIGDYEFMLGDGELLSLVERLYTELAYHFNMKVKELITRRFEECNACKHIVRGKIIKDLGLPAIRYRKVEEEISNIRPDSATIVNSLRQYPRIKTNPEPLHKTIFLIIKPYI